MRNPSTPDPTEYVQYGCGLCAPATWINFDVSPTLRLQRLPLLGWLGRSVKPVFPKTVRYGDIVRGLPIREQACKAIYCSHVLEHLSLEDFEIALKHTFSYLRPGGTFRFVLPDLELLARRYLLELESNPEASVQFMRESYLGYPTRARGIRGAVRAWLGNSAHLWMWDFKSISQFLERAGFAEVRRAFFADSPDPAFSAVEDEGRWTDNLGVNCIRPA